MPNNLRNWRYIDVVEFLKQHDFYEIYPAKGSHHFFKGFIDKVDKLVEVEDHKKNH